MSTAKARSAHARAILGPELYERLPDTKVLLVGAGGIGCELLKNIVLVGFGKITLLDLDTIDLSNLNRQFLFKKKDVKQSKALIAAQTAAPFNPNVTLTPIHGNIKEPQYDIPWYQQFDIVLNALDNLVTRTTLNVSTVSPNQRQRHFQFAQFAQHQVNQSTASSGVKIARQLFGEDEDATGELDAAEQQGENAQEIATLRKEAQAFNSVRTALRSTSPEVNCNAAKLAFQKVFDTDIKNLLLMADMWKSRSPPVPLDFDSILDGTFNLRDEDKTQNGVNPNQAAAATPSTSSVNGNGKAASSVTGLKDQRRLSLKENVELFVARHVQAITNRLAARLQSGNETTIAFDKDDEDTLDFVTAASNLRSTAYGINTQTRWEVKEMAGNIIPAIATTNAIVSGLIVLQALQLLRRNYTGMRNVHLQYKPAVPLSTITLSKPNPGCGVCRDTYALVLCDPSRALLGDVVKGILGENNEREVSVYEDKRVLSDPDWDDNLERTLESLNVTRGKFLTIVDEEGEWGTISIGLSILPPDHPVDSPPYILPSPLPQPQRKPKLPPAESTPATPPRTSRKRSLPIDMNSDVIDLAPTPKRLKPTTTSNDLESPSKRRRLDQDGLLLVDGPGELLDDVIVID
ncbi:hypothetical protein H0H93_000217 [Arthromyces matolae]|nr:hypothetical protein H0H93_000217 [Arthromyces matolae]